MALKPTDVVAMSDKLLDHVVERMEEAVDQFLIAYYREATGKVLVPASVFEGAVESSLLPEADMDRAIYLTISRFRNAKWDVAASFNSISERKDAEFKPYVQVSGGWRD